MGRQRAHRKRFARQKLIEEVLRATPETGFRSVIEATMGLMIICRTAKFRCRCGVRFADYSGFPSDSAWVCSECKAVYRIEHAFDRAAFERRGDPRPFDWWPIGEAVQLIELPDPDQAPYLQVRIPVRTEDDPTFGCKMGGLPLHYEPGPVAVNPEPGQPMAVANLVLMMKPKKTQGES